MIQELAAQNDRQWQQIAQLPGVQVYQVPTQEWSTWSEKLAPVNAAYLEKAVPKPVAQELLDMVAAAK
jgi:ABC-type Fe3+-hydroxamate transport system substrate-binding protein